jgi:subtilisin family serine protease
MLHAVTTGLASRADPADPLELVGLPPLMSQTAGSPSVRIGLIDGPVALDHPALAGSRIEVLPAGTIPAAVGAAQAHGTFMTGILCARRGSAVPGLCPDCTVLTRPIFSGQTATPSATMQDMAAAIYDCIAAGARILNLSAAIVGPASGRERVLEAALDAAMAKGVLIVAASGNQGSIGGTAITRHPWVIPVTACDRRGWPLPYANLGQSISRRGLTAPGEGITSLTPVGATTISGGTSVAAALVSGTVALVWSTFPSATGAKVRLALHRAHPRRGLVPPLLNAGAAWRALTALMRGSA